MPVIPLSWVTVTVLSARPELETVIVAILIEVVVFACAVNVMVASPLPLELLTPNHESELITVQLVFEAILKVPLESFSELKVKVVREILRYAVEPIWVTVIVLDSRPTLEIVKVAVLGVLLM
jgi:hypothetical protein